MMASGARLRDSGIQVIGDVGWGTHFCQFYETKTDLEDVLVPFFKAGLESNERCVWVASEPLGVADAEAAMRAAVPDFPRYQREGRIEIVPYDQLYVVDGVFDLTRLLDCWGGRHDAALAAGYDGLRVTGNSFWAEGAQWESFLDYERALNTVIGRYRLTALCTYAMNRCGASEVVDVVQAHQFALLKRIGRWVLIENSERKRVAEAMERMNEALQVLNDDLMRRKAELEAANGELQAFAHTVSHDLRAPLRGIGGFAEALREDCADRLDDQGRRYLSHIETSARHMSGLIDGMLALASLTQGWMSRATVNLSQLVRSSCEELRRQQPERAVDCIIQEGVSVEGDPNMLRAVIDNLVDNAWKFTSSRDRARIEFGVVAGGTERVFFVRDNGVGFDMAHAGNLFKPFHRLHTAQGFPGTGIGLASVQRVIARHGGRTWAEAAPDQGATVFFTLT
ncbi:MAG: MEDS domain-containing protein [Alphaproteobacteria bacterium]